MKREPVAYIPPTLFDTGINEVVVCRYKPNDMVEAGVFLVDVWCLGVKNTFFMKEFVSEFEQNNLPRIFRGDVPDPRPAADGRKLVEGAVAYARNLGIAPHSDYKKAARVFGGIDPKASEASFTYGKDGKPFYISGPYDNSERILAILRNKLDPGDFHFIEEISKDEEL